MVSSISRYSSVNYNGGSSFGVVAVYGKCGVGPKTIHLSYQKVYCWIGGGDFILYQNRDYTEMSHSNKNRSNSLSYQSKYNQFITYDDGKGCVGPSTTQLSSKKVYFSETGMMRIFISQLHRTVFPLVSSWSSYYTFKYYDNSSFSVPDSDGKGGVGPSNTNF